MLKTGGREKEPGSLLSVLRLLCNVGHVSWVDRGEIHICLGRTPDLPHCRPYRCGVLQLCCCNEPLTGIPVTSSVKGGTHDWAAVLPGFHHTASVYPCQIHGRMLLSQRSCKSQWSRASFSRSHEETLILLAFLGEGDWVGLKLIFFDSYVESFLNKLETLQQYYMYSSNLWISHRKIPTAELMKILETQVQILKDLTKTRILYFTDVNFYPLYIQVHLLAITHLIPLIKSNSNKINKWDCISVQPSLNFLEIEQLVPATNLLHRECSLHSYWKLGFSLQVLFKKTQSFTVIHFMVPLLGELKSFSERQPSRVVHLHCCETR